MNYELRTTNYKLILIVHCSLLIVYSYAQCNFRSIGHRGGDSYYYPENTLYAIEQSFVEGVWAAEVDVRQTADGILVLCHDGFIDRITSESGYIGDLKYSYLKTLDAAGWFDKRFDGLAIPSLADALKLAEKYHKKLYLDIVGWNPQLLVKTIKDAGVSPEICFPDPASFQEVSQYHSLLPQLPLVYFGEFPLDVADDSWYQFLKDNGVIAYEAYYDDILDTLFNPSSKYFLHKLHEFNIELWLYTINDTNIMKAAKRFGIDGIESDRPAALLSLFCDNGDAGFFPEKRITGQWDFNNKDLSPSIGSKMIEAASASTQQSVAFNTTAGFGIANINGVSANVMFVPPFDSLHFLAFFSNIPPEDIPSPMFDRNYTIIMDLLKPSASVKKYISLFQTDYMNNNDATAFIKNPESSIGCFGMYHGKVPVDSWSRIALVIDAPNHRFDKYIDGKFVGTTVIANSSSGKFALYNAWGGVFSLFFSDNDGETDNLYVSSIQVRSYAMDSAEVKALGAASPDKIPQSIKIDIDKCPEILKQPENIVASEADNITFTIKASPGVNYLWQMNFGKIWEDIKGSEFSGKASPVLKIKNIPLTFNFIKFRCIVSNDCRVTSQSVSLSVKPKPAIYGTITYDNILNSPLRNSRILLLNNENIKIDSTFTDALGNYKFSNLVAGNYILIPVISMQWGGANPLDALILNKFFLNLTTIDSELRKAASDVNNDNFINSSDALFINRRYIASISSFPQSDWIFIPPVINVASSAVNFNMKVICSGDVNASFNP